MTRLLHTADWQLGRQYDRFPADDAAMLAEARFVAVERLATLAAEQNVDAVLVPGDVFDSQGISDRSLHRTFGILGGTTLPWLLLPGNHDAALAESVWTRAERLGAVPDNVHLLLTPEVAFFEDIGFAALPAPLVQRHTHDDLTAWFDAAETPDGLLRIGLAHGGVTGLLPEDLDSPNPIAADRAARARLDYLALGDWHGLKQIDARTWYSGTPEPERFKDNDPGHALIVDITTPGAEPDVTPHLIGQHRWIKHRHEFAVASDLDALLRWLDERPEASVIDLALSGHLDLAAHHRLQQALARASGRQRVLEVNDEDLRVEPTDDDLAELKADGYVAEAIADLREQQAGDEHPETAREALVILAQRLREQAEASP